MSKQTFLAVDLGAESGRVMAGHWDGRSMAIEEVHRFPNGPMEIAGTLRWDVLRLWNEILTGLGLAGKRFGGAIRSVGVDAWGVDYTLLSKSGELLGLPFCYRDARTLGVLDRMFDRVPREEIFAQTGVQFMEINTLPQLCAANERNPEILAVVDCFLTIPDFVNWCLTGVRVCEFTNATTTQCLNAQTRGWATGLIEKLGLPTRIFPEVVAPGTKLGRLRSEIALMTGLTNTGVVAPATHDTGSAVVGVPTEATGSTKWAYISSGTWSLMGLEVPHAILSQRALELNVTNEGGVDGCYRLLKNIPGMWLLQKCRKAFEDRGTRLEYAELIVLAEKAVPFRTLINPDAPAFLNPPDMPEAIRQFCLKTGQPAPESEGAFARCALESLALKYALVLRWLEELSGDRVEVIHIVGGGSRNGLLNQFTANACQRTVLAGPVEATTMGNLLMQARTFGEIGSLAELRCSVRQSAPVTRFEPEVRSIAAWSDALGRFRSLP
ncbi:MAG: rhamnulokinase [Pedosphaera sp.]|nr:rhamnulokinase [Pedosphaera sp.]